MEVEPETTSVLHIPLKQSIREHYSCGYIHISIANRFKLLCCEKIGYILVTLADKMIYRLTLPSSNLTINYCFYPLIYIPLITCVSFLDIEINYSRRFFGL